MAGLARNTLSLSGARTNGLPASGTNPATRPSTPTASAAAANRPPYAVRFRFTHHPPLPTAFGVPGLPNSTGLPGAPASLHAAL